MSDINLGSYVCLRLTGQSEDRIARWAERQGFANPMDKSDYHITVCYSTQALHYVPLGVIPPMPVKPIGFDLFGKDKGYLVMRVKSRLASNRNDYAMMSGAVSDFPDYKPHISLAKDSGLTSTKDLEPFTHTLYVNREEYHVLNPSFKPEAMRINPMALKALFASEDLIAATRHFKPEMPTDARLADLKTRLKAQKVKARLKKLSGSLSYAVRIALDSDVGLPAEEGRLALARDRLKVNKIGAELGLIATSLRSFDDPDILNSWNGHQVNVYFTQ